MKNLRCILSILLLCIGCMLHAQNSYVILNDTLQAGVTIIQQTGRNKFHSIILKENKKEVKYTPDVISEYSDNGTLYYTFPNPLSANKEKVFLQLVVKDESMAVYYFVDKSGSHLFYKPIGGEFIAIDKTNNAYADYIYNKQGSPEWLKEYKIKPDKGSIKLLHKVYLSGNRNQLTRNRFGVWVGGGFSMVDKTLLNKDIKDNHLLVGVFADLPVYNGFSIRPELFYLKETAIESSEEEYTYQDATFNRESLIIPLLIKYTFINTKGKLLPFLQAGPTIHYNLKSKIEQRTIIQKENGVSKETVYPENKKNFFSAGLSAGAGIEYKITAKRSLFFDVRYLMGSESHLFYATVSVNL